MHRQTERRVVPGLAGLAGLAAAGLLGTDARDARAETLGINWYDTQTGIWKTDGPLDYPYVTGLNVGIVGPDIVAASNGMAGSDAARTSYVIKLQLPEDKRFKYQVGSDPSITQGLTIGTGDLDGDGKLDVVAARASGLGSTLYQALNNPNGLQFEPLPKDAYDDGFKGGVNVAVIPADKDHEARFITTPVSGTPGTPTPVQVLTRHIHKAIIKLRPFAYAGMDDYDGGIQTAVGDFDGDGMPDVVLAAYGNMPKMGKIAVYDTEMTAPKMDFTVDASGPISLAAADFNGDGFSDLVIGAAPGDLPTVQLLMNNKDGSFVLGQTLLAYDSNYRGGVNVAAGDLNGDGFADIVTAPASAVPEPGTVAVIGAVAILGCARRPRRKPG